MPLCRLMLLAGVGLSVFAQAPCNNTPAFTPCEFAFDLNPQEAAAHPNPYVDVELSAEFRSPHFHTFKLTAFWDGGQRPTPYVDGALSAEFRWPHSPAGKPAAYGDARARLVSRLPRSGAC